MLARPVSRCAYQTPNLQFGALSFRVPISSAFFATASRPQHRPSSSKTSTPPGGSNPANGPRSPTHSTTTTRPSPSGALSDVVDKRRIPPTAVGRRKQKGHEASAEDLVRKARHEAFGHMPAVPPTTHLALEDVKLSSLFAMDRPIPVTKTGYPPYVDSKRFNSIFEPRTTAHRIDDTTYTLTSAISALDSTTSTQDLRAKILLNSPSNNGTIHLDEPPSLEQLTKQYRPYQKPPAPIPLGNPTAVRAEAARRAAADAREAKQIEEAEKKARQAAPQKTWTTTLTIEERTDGKGGSTFSASASPIMEQEVETDLADLPPGKYQVTGGGLRLVEKEVTPARQPFLSRMRAREAAHIRDLEERVKEHEAAMSADNTIGQCRDQDVNGEASLPAAPKQDDVVRGETSNVDHEMLLISVKRQRKLKMKKHKYKKLMRRTRNLRRREGRN